MLFGEQSLQGIESHRRHADGVRVENIPGILTLGLLEKIQSTMRDLQCEPEHFNGRTIFMAMIHDIAWGENGNTEKCVQNSIKVSKYARRFPWIFGSEKKRYEICSNKPDGNWDRTAETMILKLNTESGHPIFRASSAFERVDFVDRYTSHVIILMHFAHNQTCACHTAWLKTSHPTCLYARGIPSSCHPWCVLERLLSVSSCLSFSCFSLSFTSSLPYPTCTMTCTSSMSMSSRELIPAPSPIEECCLLAIYHPLTDVGSQRHVKKSTHSNENEGNIALLLRTVISVNQLSIYGSHGRSVQRIERRFRWRFIRRLRKLGTLKCKTLTWRKRNNLWDRLVQNISNVNDKISNSNEEKTLITMSIVKLDGTTESHGETRRQRLHLQLHSGQLHSGKRVGTHGSRHHLRYGGDFGFLEGIPENRRSVKTGHQLKIHICAEQFVHKRGTHTQRDWLKNCIVIFVRLKRI